MTPENKQRTKQNRNRSRKLSYLKRLNLHLSTEITGYLQHTTMEPERLEYLNKFNQYLCQCANDSMYREIHVKPKTITYIASDTCDHKVCFICNSLRSKILRRKYRIYLTKNVEWLKDHDVFHLTLTVPHTEEHGWRGQRFYAVDMKTEFNWMRKKPFWKKQVIAGEYGFEITRNNNGMHIHIHSLLFVKKTEQSRNKLFKDILFAWNAQTTDTTGARQSFDEKTIEAIWKSIKGLKGTYKSMLKTLDPTGSTMVGLESLYTLTKKKLGKRDVWIKEKKVWKHYVSPIVDNVDGVDQIINFEQVMDGIMECIKYHFEPFVMQDETENYNIEFIAELLPLIYRKPLYSKFGKFYGVSELNLNVTLSMENLSEVLAETAAETILHPDTEDQLFPEDYTYIVANPRYVFHDKDTMKPVLDGKRVQARFTEAETMREAMQQKIEYVNQRRNERLNPNLKAERIGNLINGFN